MQVLDKAATAADETAGSRPAAFFFGLAA